MGMANFGLSKGVTEEPIDVFNVMDFGAAGDGVKDDSHAILMGWKAMCGSSKNHASFTIPMGTFTFRHAILSGPCKPKTINFRIEGHVVALMPLTGNHDSWITFTKVNGLHVHGHGTIDGRGYVWWKKYENPSQRPTALYFSECNNLKLYGTTHINSPRNHISISHCNGVTISDLHIRAPSQSPNTDGINIYRSTRVNIHNCIIGTGDDCVAIIGGSYDVNVTNVACGPGHGISIGSLGKDGSHATVEKIGVSNCNFTGTQNGARIKTWQGGSGYARNIVFKDIIVKNVDNPILIDQYYCPHRYNCKDHTSAVAVSNVIFANVKGTSKQTTAINLSCSRTVPCKNVWLVGVKITNADPTQKTRAHCVNVYGVHKVTVPGLADCMLQVQQ